jgi:hypothetical protein
VLRLAEASTTPPSPVSNESATTELNLKTTKSLDDHLDDWKDKPEALNDQKEDMI